MEEFDDNYEHKTDKEKNKDLERQVSNYSWTIFIIAIYLAFKYSIWWLLLIIFS